MTLRLLPDAERCFSAFIRDDTDIAAAATDLGIDEVRCVTEWGRNQTFPAIKVTRIGGSPIGGHAYAAESVIVQVDVMGGNKLQTNGLAEAARSGLMQNMNGRLTIGDVEFVAHRVIPGGIRPAPDPKRPGQDSTVTDSTSPASKPAVQFDVVAVLSV